MEVHLSVGEALVCCVLGPSSPVSRDPWVVLESEFEPPPGNASDSVLDLVWLFDRLLKEMVKEPHPNQKQVRFLLPMNNIILNVMWHCCWRKQVCSSTFNIYFLQACCLWLLALLKNCSKLQELSSRLPEVQTAFMGFLSENNGRLIIIRNYLKIEMIRVNI